MKLIITLFALILLVHSHILSQDVKIGSQIWMSKNLDVSKFRNGEDIPQAKSKEQWEYAAENNIPVWCYYDFDDNNGKIYGKLYNWYAVIDTRGLTPEGYHVPSEIEWNALINFLGGKGIAGKKMKSNNGWKSFTEGGKKTCPNCEDWSFSYREKVPCNTCKDNRYIKIPEVTISGNGDNSSGLNFSPSGNINIDGSFGQSNTLSKLWSTTIYNQRSIVSLQMTSSDLGIYWGDYSKGGGLSVRCIKTNSTIDNNKDVKQDKKSIKIFFEK